MRKRKWGGVRLKNKKKGRKGNMDQRCVDRVKTHTSDHLLVCGLLFGKWAITILIFPPFLEIDMNIFGRFGTAGELSASY